MMQELWHGDCLELMKDIPDKSVDAIICDLPFGTTQNKWDSVIPFDELWDHYWRIAKSNAAIILNAQAPFDKALGFSQLKYLKYEWIWEKGRATGHLNCKKQPLKLHENILVFYKKQCVYNPQMVDGELYSVGGGKSKNDNYGDFSTKRENDGRLRYPKSILKIKTETGLHPTQKPVKLTEYLIKTYTNEGGLVLDNCMGSGTTCLAAKNLNRQFIGIEKEKEYYDICAERLK